MEVPKTVNIAPGVAMLTVLGSLPYKPWFALAEYVDNSLQSHLTAPVGSAPEILRVTIDFDPSGLGELVITDNAQGIQLADFPRAFRAASVPPDRTGLSEFGMGMKSASCWFAQKWSVTTSVNGEATARTVTYDIEDIVERNTVELKIEEAPEQAGVHYTQVRLWNLNRPLATRTIGKIKEHLTDIYRVFLRSGTLELYFRDELLAYVEPETLTTPPFDTPDAPAVEWRKEINFDFGHGLEVKGFAALLASGLQSRAGFSLFRRGRIVEGSGDELYKPADIYGAGNTYRSQRLFGELHLDGFEVSHTKDGFQWFDSEAAFLDLLRAHLDALPTPLLRQAEGFRVRASRKYQEELVAAAIDHTVDSLDRDFADGLIEFVAEDSLPPVDLDAASAPVYERTMAVRFRGIDWQIAIEATANGGSEKWLRYSESTEKVSQRAMRISFNLDHPFIVRFAQNDKDSFEAVLRVGAALAISDSVARMDEASAGAIFRNVGDLLSGSLSKP